jgi:hypothetical protein
MRRWQMMRQSLQGLFFVALILVSCSAPESNNPQEGCGGTEATVSCLQINSIVPVADLTPTSNVDVHQDVCIDPATGKVINTERFTGDHNAQVTLLNKQFPTASGGFDIRLLGFSVSYRLNQCPALARGCPPLTGFTIASQTAVIPQGTSLTLTLPLVPLRVKQEYVAAGGEVFSASLPSYGVTYTFTAETISFNQTFTVSGATEVTIGDFLTNGFTCQGIIQ